MRQRLFSLLKVGISLALLAWLLSEFGVEETLAPLASAEPLWLTAAVAFFALGVWLRAWRWQALLRALGARVGLGRLTQLYLVGFFFSKLLPGGLGGDVVRGAELAGENTTGAEAAGTVIVDRLTGLLVLFGLALLALPFSLDLVDPALALFLGGVALGGILAGWLLWQERLVAALAGLWPGRWRFRWLEELAGVYQAILACRGAPLRKALWASLGVNVTVIGLNYAAAVAVGVRVSLGYFFLFVPLIALSLLVPISWGGLGLREGVTALLFAFAGVSRPEAVAMSLMVYLVNTAFSLLGGAIYLETGLSGLRDDSGVGKSTQESERGDPDDGKGK